MYQLTSWQRFLPVAFALAVTAILLDARSSTEIIVPHRDLREFPTQIGNRHATDLSLSAEELGILGPGEFLVREYLSSSDVSVNLYIAYFPSQRSGDTIHSPRNCLPGAGWAPVESEYVRVKRNDRSTIAINQYIIAKGNERDLVFYWYQSHGRVTPSEYWGKIFLVKDAIQMNRTDGALVRVVTPITNSGGKQAAQARGLDFVHEILSVLDAYIPR